MPKPGNDLSAPQKDARAFDDWFYSQSKDKQEAMRQSGVLPYKEMVQPRRVFEINPGHKAWTYSPEHDRIESDSFISREHVGSMLKAFIDALAASADHQVRRHVELVRWSLSLPGFLPAPVIASMYGVSKQAIHKRAKTIRQQLAPDALDSYAMMDRMDAPGKGRRSSCCRSGRADRINRISIKDNRPHSCIIPSITRASCQKHS